VSTQELAAVVAVIGGIVIAVVLFVPLAAVLYRSNGRLTSGDLLTLLTGAVYGLALWTYTLLPLPDGDDFQCREPVTRVREVTRAVRSYPHSTLLDLARNPMVLQILLNVALFVPLGVLLRVRARRGVLVAAATGSAVSLLIEVTQYTGIWGLYRCAYRYFDIGDLIANSTGAVAGSILAALVFGRRPEPRAKVAPSLTAGRRLVSLVSDLLVMGIVGAVTVVGWRAWLLAGREVAVEDIDLRAQVLLQWGVPFALEAMVVLVWGRTIGEAVVQLRTRARRPGWTLPGRLVKVATGVGLLAVLAAGGVPGSGWLLLAFVVAHVAGAALAPGGRGLSNFLAGLDVELTGSPDHDDG
jgi:glycopeptide antibiotics resistance protein